MNTRQTAAAALNTLILIVASVAATGSWLAPLILYGIMIIGTAILLAAYIGVAASQGANDLDAIKAKIKTSNDGVGGFILRVIGLALMSVLLYLLAPAEMAVQLVLVYLITIVTSRTIRWLITGKASHDEEGFSAMEGELADLIAKRDAAKAKVDIAQRTGDWSNISDRDHAAYEAAVKMGFVKGDRT